MKCQLGEMISETMPFRDSPHRRPGDMQAYLPIPGLPARNRSRRGETRGMC